MQRVSIVGNSGSGKTVLAHEIAAALGAPVIQLDAVFHQPGWEPLPADLFRDRIRRMTTGDRWVVDGNYAAVRDIVWSRADTVIWLDLPRWRVMVRVIRRSLGRLSLGQELWNGNRERWANLLKREPDKNIVLWAWTTHAWRRRQYAALMIGPAEQHEHWIRLRSPAEVHGLVARLMREEGGG